MSQASDKQIIAELVEALEQIIGTFDADYGDNEELASTINNARTLVSKARGGK